MFTISGNVDSEPLKPGLAMSRNGRNYGLTPTPAGAARTRSGSRCGRAETPDPHFGRSQFTTTHWSVVLAAAGDEPAALERLCRTYWRPLYVVAQRLGHCQPDAQDLTQAFFEQFLQKGYIRAADPQRGRFRTFLFTSFRHFLRGEWVKRRALKRGGAARFLPWDTLSADEQTRFEPAWNLPAEAVFDREWALSVFERALAQLRDECAAAGRARQFDQLKPFLSQLGTQTDYARVGEQARMTPGAVAVAVRRLRVRYGELLRAEIAHTVAGPEEIEEEIRALFAALES